jgi:hypothetical protein
MPGRWGVRFEVAFGHTRSQTVSVVDEIRP